MDEPDWENLIDAQQATLDQDIERLARWATDHPDISAGVWWDIDSALAGTGPVRMVLGVTADTTAIAAEVRQFLDHPDYLDIQPKRHTERDLETLKQRIVIEESARASHGGVRVSFVGIDLSRNRVKVSLRRPDPAAANAILDRYGADRVHVSSHILRFRRGDGVVFGE